MRTQHFFTSILISVFLVNSAAANLFSSSRLNTLTQEITALRQHLFSASNQRQDIYEQLKDSEINIGKIAESVYQTNALLNQQQKLLATLQTQYINYQQQLNEQTAIFQQHILAAYQLGTEPFLKILLNQENPQLVTRYLNYYHYLLAARIAAMQQIQQTLVNIQQTSSQIAMQTKTLQATQQQQEQQKSALLQQKQQRQQLLTQINQQISTSNAQLNKLYADKQRLQAQITALTAPQTISYAPGKSFAQEQGALVWPINGGHIVQAFGSPLTDGRLQSTGILLQAPAGTKVQSIYAGKVVFANWLRGFGLLVIIQHGQNYLTLYGRNQSLYVKVGDMVTAGQMIATVGNSGGFAQSSLYFEIRYLGQAVNPLDWLKRR